MNFWQNFKRNVKEPYFWLCEAILIAALFSAGTSMWFVYMALYAVTAVVDSRTREVSRRSQREQKKMEL